MGAVLYAHAPMKQKTFDLTESQLARLSLEADRSGQGQAEIVRAALEMLFASRFTPYPATSQGTSPAVPATAASTPEATSRATSRAVPPPLLEQHQPGHQPGHQQGSASGGGIGGGGYLPGIEPSGKREDSPLPLAGRRSTLRAPLPENAEPPPEDIAEAALLWLQYKRERGQPYKPVGLRQLYLKLQEFGPEKALRVVKESVARNYQGLADTESGNGGAARATPVDRHVATLERENKAILGDQYDRYYGSGGG